MSIDAVTTDSFYADCSDAQEEIFEGLSAFKDAIDRCLQLQGNGLKSFQIGAPETPRKYFEGKHVKPMMASCSRVEARVSYNRDGTVTVEIVGERDLDDDLDFRSNSKDSPESSAPNDHDRDYEGDPNRALRF